MSLNFLRTMAVASLMAAPAAANAATILSASFGPHPMLSGFGVSQAATQFELDIGGYEGLTSGLPFETDVSVNNADDGTGVTHNVASGVREVFSFGRGASQSSTFDLLVDAILPPGFDGQVQVFVADFGSTVADTLADLGATASSDFSFINEQITARDGCGGSWFMGTCDAGGGSGGSGGGSPPEVPLPASALLLLAGFIGLAELRRRKRAA